MRGPAAAVFARAVSSRCKRRAWTIPVLRSRGRTRSASPIGSHEPRSHDAGRAMSKFHRISATPAIKDRARRGDLTDGRGVSTSTSGTAAATSFTDLNGVTATTTITNDVTPKCTSASASRPGWTRRRYRKKKKKEGKLQGSAPCARVLCAAHDPRVCPLCVVSPTDRLTDRMTGITKAA